MERGDGKTPNRNEAELERDYKFGSGQKNGGK